MWTFADLPRILAREGSQYDPRLPNATFQDKRDIIAVLKIRFEFVRQGNQKVVDIL